MSRDETGAGDPPLDTRGDEGAEGGVPLCPHCLSPNDPLATFCQACDGPLSHLAVHGPLETVMSQGHAYRVAVDRPSRILLIGMWGIFLPAILGLTIPFGIGLYQKIWPGDANLIRIAIDEQTGDPYLIRLDPSEVQPDWSGIALGSVAGAFILGLLVIYAVLLFKVTRNYLRQRTSSDREVET